MGGRGIYTTSGDASLCSQNGRKGLRDVRIIAKRTLVEFW